MKFRDIISGKETLNESEVKFEALAIMKKIHSSLATLSFVDVIAKMREENPLRKDVNELEKALNVLTTQVGEFVTNNLEDAVDLEQADVQDKEDNAEEEEEKEIKKAEAEGKGKRKAELEKEEETNEATKGWKKITSYLLGKETEVFTNDSGYTFGKVDGKWVMVDFDDNVVHTGKSAAEMKRHYNSWLTEGSPIQDLTKIIAKTLYMHEYEMALKMMHKEGIIAADAARRFKHVDARLLAKMAKDIK